MRLSGVWLPIVTPFYQGQLDEAGYRSLIEFYLAKGINGLIPLGTTGESPTISEMEFERIIDLTLSTVNKRIPVYIGVGGNATQKVLHKLKIAEKYNIDGILSICPYYNRPSQQGLFEHFKRISEATDLNIIIYNIPYRTGVNMANETLFRLAEQSNIIGIKDSCGDINQSLSLLRERPESLAVLTGEDQLYYTMLANGGDGGILATAHIYPEDLIGIYQSIQNDSYQTALEQWRKFEAFIPLLFQEPNPAPVKYCLQHLGLIRSGEVRLPLMTVSNDLADQLAQGLDANRFQ
jgi:4-hydroxy-tetrahydrodipicolinate synthase